MPQPKVSTFEARVAPAMHTHLVKVHIRGCLHRNSHERLVPVAVAPANHDQEGVGDRLARHWATGDSTPLLRNVATADTALTPSPTQAITTKDGSKYTGGWKDARMHGEGELRGTDGTYYKGMFKEGQMHGHGRLSTTNGVCVIRCLDKLTAWAKLMCRRSPPAGMKGNLKITACTARAPSRRRTALSTSDRM